MMRIAVFAVVLLLLGGCRHKPPYIETPLKWRWADVGKTCAADAPASELPLSTRDSLGHPFGTPGKYDDVWGYRASIARTVPGGWGGLTGREKGNGFAIYLVDTTERDAAIAALISAEVPYISPGIEVRRGRWTYVQIYDWFRYIHSHLRGVAVTSWSLDESNNRIVYGVEDEAAGRELDRQLTGMNVPCFLVAERIMGRLRLQSSSRR
jgi:hypothetical protein